MDKELQQIKVSEDAVVSYATREPVKILERQRPVFSPVSVDLTSFRLTLYLVWKHSLRCLNELNFPLNKKQKQTDALKTYS